MEMITELATVTVTRKKDGVAGIIGRAFSFIIGGCLLLIGALLFITIIGILPGIGLAMIGILMMAAGISNTQSVQCPHCKKRMNVQKDSEDFKCARCTKPVILRWIKY